VRRGKVDLYSITPSARPSSVASPDRKPTRRIGPDCCARERPYKVELKCVKDDGEI
jgi:hypothetical protein